MTRDADPPAAEVEIRPLDAAHWPDLCALFGRNGANSGCWCMWWRLSANDWSAGARAAANEAGTGTRAAFQAVVDADRPTGLLAYRDSAPVGWCAVAPRADYPRLLRSPTLAPADPDEPGVWSVTCFYIHRAHRRTGLGHTLLTAAVRHAADAGATAVEGYPVDTGGVRGTSGDFFTGTVDQFRRAGFTAQPRPRSGKRVVMRRDLSG